MSNNALQGTLPESWFQKDSFPQLAQLKVANNYLGGPLPRGPGSFLQSSGSITLLPQQGPDSFCGDASNLTVLTVKGEPAYASIRPCTSGPGAPLQQHPITLETTSNFLGSTSYTTTTDVDAASEPLSVGRSPWTCKRLGVHRVAGKGVKGAKDGYKGGWSGQLPRAEERPPLLACLWSDVA